MAPSAARDRIAGEVLRTARKAWPGLEVPEEAFAEHVLGRLPPDWGLSLDEQTLARLSDLYLACGAVRQDPVALAAVDTLCKAEIPRAVRNLGLDQEATAEVRQLVLLKILVSERGPPKIAEYSGRGALRGWLRAVAARVAIDLCRQRKATFPAAAEVLAEATAATTAPELQILREKYQREFKAAFEDALKELDAETTLLLKRHYVDGLSVRELAELERVHRVTVHRRLETARETLKLRVEALLRARLALDPSTLQSVIRVLHGDLEVSISRFLVPRAPAGAR